MRFSTTTWRKYYDEIQNLGQILKNSRPDKDGNPPISKLTKDTQVSLEKDIKSRTENVSKYLIETNTNPWPPLWIFDIDDETTWYSSDKFMYRNLMK